MKIVIDIPEEDWEFIKESDGCRWSRAIIEGVINGTPLPKGHGRLIDISDIEPMSYTVDGGDYYDDYKAIDWEDIEKAPTIIKAESEGKADADSN